MTIEELHVGAEVYWNDPDEGAGSGYFTVVEIVGEILRLKNEEGTFLEAFLHELS